jgi:hypothetical protein
VKRPNEGARDASGQRARTLVESLSPTSADHLQALVEIIDAQEQLMLAAAGGADPSAINGQLWELERQFRYLASSIGQIEPPFKVSMFYAWHTEATSRGSEWAERTLERRRTRVDALFALLTGEPRWELIPFEDSLASFARDLEKLDRPERDALEKALEDVLAVHGSGLIGSKWIHKLVDGDGVYEFRVDNDSEQIARRVANSDQVPTAASIPDDEDFDWGDRANDLDDLLPDVTYEADPLVRAFFIFDGRRVIVLLHAYDKGADDSPKRQAVAIREAKRRATRYRASRSASGISRK